MEELNFLIKIVKKAYKKYVDRKNKIIDEKPNCFFNADFVTSCDKNVERFLTYHISKKFPNDNIIGEEYNSKNELQGRCWIIDPIDGTVNFSRDLPMWCIQVAFVINGETKCSVIYIPTLKELYTADNTGTYLNGKLIKIDKSIDLSHSIVNMCDI